jgi:hypothetical protein
LKKAYAIIVAYETVAVATVFWKEIKYVKIYEDAE